MDTETKKTLEKLQETVVLLAKSVENDKEARKTDSEKTQKILAEVKTKQDEFEVKRKGMFIDDDVVDNKGILNLSQGTKSLDIIMGTKSLDEKVQELQKSNDEILLVSQLLNVNPRETKIYQEFRDGNPFLKKAMDTGTAGEGSEWIPTGYSPRLFDRVRLELVVAGLHESIAMPTSIYKPPVVTSDSVGYLIPEMTEDDASLTAANRITASKPGTGNFTLTAKKIAGRIIFSEELSEDSIVPVLPLLNNNIVIAIATAIETAILNGDTAGTHQDSDVTSARDVRKAWDGYRKLAKSAAKVSLATFNGDTLMSVRKAMGKYGVKPSSLALVTGISVYSQMLNLRDSQNNVLVTTIDKYGANATILTGELGKVYGIPIIVSENIRENLNASGVYDATTTTKTVLHLVYRPGLILGDRRVLKVETARDINVDQTVLVATTRRAFSAVYQGATDYIIGTGYNIAI